nr:hypothetical protein KPHV_60810 [Kitasatospora purpeofusca]
MIWDQSVVRVRAGTRTDRSGNTVADWSPGAVARATITRVSVQPVLQTERQESDRTSVVTGWRVLSEPGTAPDVRAGDRIEYDGLLCEVQGEVGRWPHPVLGGVHHVEWQMRRSTG